MLINKYISGIDNMTYSKKNYPSNEIFQGYIYLFKKDIVNLYQFMNTFFVFLCAVFNF